MTSKPYVSVPAASRLARNNPFTAERIHQLRYLFAQDNIASLLERFTQLQERGALVAQKGHGKTTLLEELLEIFRQTERDILHITLHEGDPHLPKEYWQCLQQPNRRSGKSQRRLIVLDGAEQLSWWQWRRFRYRLKPEEGCLITSHRPGLLPTLHQCSTTCSQLISLVEQLQGSTTPHQQIVLQELFQRHQGDIRLCFRELYDQYSNGIWPPTAGHDS